MGKQMDPCANGHNLEVLFQEGDASIMSHSKKSIYNKGVTSTWSVKAPCDSRKERRHHTCRNN